MGEQSEPAGRPAKVPFPAKPRGEGGHPHCPSSQLKRLLFLPCDHSFSTRSKGAEAFWTASCHRGRLWQSGKRRRLQAAMESPGLPPSTPLPSLEQSYLGSPSGPHRTRLPGLSSRAVWVPRFRFLVGTRQHPSRAQLHNGNKLPDSLNLQRSHAP